MKNRVALCLVFCLTTACNSSSISDYLKNQINFNSPDHNMNLTPSTFEELKGWETNKTWSGFKAFVTSCKSLTKRPTHNMLSAYAGTYGDWSSTCISAIELHKKAKHSTKPLSKTFFETHFTPYLVTNNGNREGFLTGYYESQLSGSLTKQGIYQHPVYMLPPFTTSHLSRKDIDNGALANKKLEIVYVSDPVELFFLHVQGSGRIALSDGTTLRIGYAGQNGQDYHSIGRYLVDQGIFTLEEVTAEKIKRWLRNNPQKMYDVLHQNPSYIFFRKLDNEGGPIGAQGVPLTPLGSIAVDKRFIPLGTPMWIDTTTDGTSPLNILVTAQDTGGAIKGVIRGDIFFGHGNIAQQRASGMKHPATFHLLLPNNITPTVNKWRTSNIDNK